MIYKFTNLENISVYVIEDNGSCKKSLLVTGVDLNNTDYQAYLKWLDEGNTPLPAENN